MKFIFRVNVKIPEYREINLYFDDPERAERLVSAVQQIMSEDGLKKVKFEYHKEAVIDSDQDVLDALRLAQSDGNDWESLIRSRKTGNKE